MRAWKVLNTDIFYAVIEAYQELDENKKNFSSVPYITSRCCERKLFLP